MKFATFCALAATLAALAISAPMPLLSDADPTLLESDETLSLGPVVFCPKDFKTDGLSSIAALRVTAAQVAAYAQCGIAKARTSLETTKYEYVVSLFRQNTQRTTWRTQANVDEQKRTMDNAKTVENTKCLCKDKQTTAQQEAAIAATPAPTPSFPLNTANYDYGVPNEAFCPADYSTSQFSKYSDGNVIRSKQQNANSQCNSAYSTTKIAQGTYNEAVKRLSGPNPKLHPSVSDMIASRAAFNQKIAEMEKTCECSVTANERTNLENSAQDAITAMTAAQNAADAEAKASADAKDAAEAKAQAEGYSSVQGKIDAWSKATAEADAAAKQSASAKAAEAAQRNAQAAADANAKKAAAADAAAKAKADAQAKAVSEAKADAQAKAAAEAQAAADKAATDVWRTEIATATKTVSSSATVTSVATATASGQGTGSATESASGSAAVAKSGASETASVTESVTDSKTATSTATQEASATESATQSATATRTAPGTKVHFSAKGLCDAKA